MVILYENKAHGAYDHVFIFACTCLCGILVLWPRIKPAPPKVQVLNLNRWTAWEVPLWPFNASERFGVITVIITQLYTQVLVSHGPEVSVTLASFFSFFCFFLYTHTHTHTHTYIYVVYIFSVVLLAALNSCWHVWTSFWQCRVHALTQNQVCTCCSCSSGSAGLCGLPAAVSCPQHPFPHWIPAFPSSRGLSLISGGTENQLTKLTEMRLKLS